MLADTELQFRKIVKFQLDYLINFWQLIREADDSIIFNQSLSNEAFDAEHNHIKLLLNSFFQISKIIEDNISSWSGSNFSFDFKQELDKLKKLQEKCESYLLSGFCRITPEEMAVTLKSFEELKKLFNEIDFAGLQ